MKIINHHENIACAKLVFCLGESSTKIIYHRIFIACAKILFLSREAGHRGTSRGTSRVASRGTSCGTARDGPGRLAGRLVGRPAGRPAGRPLYFESKRCVSKYKKQYFGNVIYVFCPGRLAEVVCDKLSFREAPGGSMR